MKKRKRLMEKVITTLFLIGLLSLVWMAGAIDKMHAEDELIYQQKVEEMKMENYINGR